MATYATLTVNVVDIIGADFDRSRCSVWLETNTESGLVIVDGTTVRLGGRREAPDDSGIVTFANVVTTNSAANPAEFAYRVRIIYVPKGSRKQGHDELVTSDFPLTTNANLATISAAWDDIALPVNWRSDFLDEANAILAAQQAIADADTAADLITALDANASSTFRTQQDARQAAAYAAKSAQTTVESGRLSDTTLKSTFGRKNQLLVGASNSDYTTLSSALAAAVAGDEIVLRGGTYTISGANTIPAGVKVRAAQSAAVTLQGTYSTTVSALTLQAGAMLEGLTIKNLSATGGTGVHVAADIRGAGAEVRNCTFVGPWTQAILGYQVPDVRVVDCTFDSIGRTTGTTPGDAINLYGINGGTVQGCLFRDLRQNAVYVNAGSKNVTISGNTVRGGCEGVQVRVGCSNVTIVGNTFDIKGASGVISFGIIVQTQCVDTVISNNTFRTTAGTATPIAAITIDDRSHRAIVEGNSISAAGFASGIKIATTGAAGTESINCVVSANIIDSPAGIGIQVAAGEVGSIVSNNRIVGGTSKGISVLSDRATVVGNQVTACSGDGVTIGGAYSTASANVVCYVSGSGIVVTGIANSVTGNSCTGNTTYGISETGNSNVVTGNNCGGNSHASTDINSAGASSKVAYNIGRYTAKGAA